MRNYELSLATTELGPFPNNHRLPNDFDSSLSHDAGENGMIPHLDGTTNLVFDPVTGETISYVISAVLDGDSIVQLFSGNLAHADTLNPNTFTEASLTDIVPFKIVKGFRFSTTGPIVNPQLNLPMSTTFTFTVLETSAALLTMLSLTFFGIRRSRS